MNTNGLPRQKNIKAVGRNPLTPASQQYLNDPQVRDIEATAHTGEPTRSFKMSFQYEEAARYRSQQLRDEADLSRTVREARLAQRMRRQTESGARRARRTLASMLLG